MKQAEQYIKAHNFFACIYRTMAIAIPGEEEWQKIGKEEDWTPEQIANYTHWRASTSVHRRPA